MNYDQHQIDAFILEAKDRATAVERERCAQVAESLGQCPIMSDRDDGFNAACELVAKKIRAGRPS